MDQTSGEVDSLVKEIHISNRFILKRLNQLCFSTGCEKCNCSCKQDAEKLIHDFHGLQESVRKLESFAKRFEDRLGAIEKQMTTFDKSLQALQTNNWGLRIARKEEQDVSPAVGRLDSENDLKQRQTSFSDDNGNPSASTKPSEIKTKIDNSKDEKQNKNMTETEHEVLSSQTMNGSDSVPSAEESERIRNLNEMNKAASSGLKKSDNTVEVLEQSVVQCHDDENFWRFLAHMEVEKAKPTLKDLEGVHAVICLDISTSMSKVNAWEEGRTFVMDYLKGLEEVSTRYGLSDEQVALVTFGHETKVQRRLTNKYKDLQSAIEHIRLGGPSPLYGGMVLSLAAAGSSEHQVHKVNFINVFTKMIIITDGHLSDQRMYAGPDSPARDPDKAKAKIVEAIEEYKSNHLDIYFVPVGQADMEFLELLVTIGEGTMVDYKDGRQMARRTYLTLKMDDPLGLGLMAFSQDSSRFSAEDKKTMEDIREKAKKMFSLPFGRLKQDKYTEIPGKNYPSIGSRVRRGPDWKWNEQDSHGPGTVIGHDQDDQVWVEWDADAHRNIYRYGGTGYDVLIVDEPRSLQHGQEIAVGCVVRPGRDCTDRSTADRGVVIKLVKDGMVAKIRWEGGKRSDCSYGKSGKQEIVVCSGFQPFETEGYVLGSTPTAQEPAQIVERKTKNKNAMSNSGRKD